MRAMENEYLCPKCRSKLRIDNYVVLSVKRSTGERGIIFLNQNLGDYSYVKNSSMIIEQGEKVDIFCPVCNENLICVPEKNLAKIFMVDTATDNLVSVLFSLVFGENVTYKVSKSKDESLKVEAYGDSAEQGLDFENLISLC